VRRKDEVVGHYSKKVPFIVRSIKMKKCLLIFPELEAKRNIIPFEFPYKGIRPPLGILYVASVLRELNLHPVIIDERVSSLETLFNLLSKEKFLFTGIYTDTFTKDKVKSLIERIKNRYKTPIIIGGPGHIHYKEFLISGADIIVHGECETSLPLIVQSIRDGILPNLENISYSVNGNIKEYKGFLLPENLDSIPFPCWEGIEIKKYYDPFLPLLKSPFVTMITSRGCPYNCAFCAVPFLSHRKYRMRSVSNVIEEISWLKKKFDINYIIFEDDCFGLKKEWLIELCESMIRKNFRIEWMCILHPSTLGKEKKEIVSLMRKAGCNTVTIGVQSPLEDVLLLLNRKPEEIEDAKETIEILKQNEIMVAVDFIVGLKMDKKKEKMAIMKFLKETKPHFPKFHPLFILPHTALYENGGENLFPFKENRVKLANSLYRWFYIRYFLRTAFEVLKRNPKWALEFFC